MKSTVAMLIMVFLAIGTAAADPATDQKDFEEFALACQDAIDYYEFEFFDEHSDVDGFLAKIQSDFPDPKGDAAKYAEGFLQAFHESGFRTMIESSVTIFPSYQFLRVHDFQGKPHMIFRLNGDSGLNYHDFLLGRDNKGGVEIKDLYVYSTGEYLSATFQNLYNQGITALDGWTDMITGKRHRLQNFLNEISKANEFMAQGEWAKAHDIWKDLAKGDIYPKGAYLGQISCAAQLNDELYIQAMGNFGQAFPNDPSWLLIAMDFELLQGRYNAATRSVNKLSKMIGGDPVLDIYQAYIQAEKGDMDKAKKVAEGIREEYPDLEDSYWALVVFALTEEDYQEVVTLLDMVKEKFGYEFYPEDMAGEEIYDSFMASEIGQAWWAQQ